MSSVDHWMAGQTWLVVLAALLVGPVGCGSGSLDEPGEASRAVTQGGPQDIGEFRAVVEAGQVPSLALLDEVGFFAEHAVDLPPAECGASVCAHGMLAVAPRFDEGNWTMAFVALNTAVDPETLPSLPRHVIVVAEHSEALFELGGRWLSVTAEAIQALGRDLSSGDSISLILAMAENRTWIDAVAPDRVLTFDLDIAPVPFEDIDHYGALARALELAAKHDASEMATSVIFVSSGDPANGITSEARFEQLAARFAAAKIPVTTIGFGEGYEQGVSTRLSELTGGNYYFASDAQDMLDAFEVEGNTAFTPVATQLEITVEASPGYHIGEVYGARRAVRDDSRTRAVLSSPILYVGSRTGSQDVASGRRGGGGGFFVQLIADAEEGESEPVESDAFRVTVRYDDSVSGAPVEFEQTLATPLGVGNNPPPDAPFFSDRARAKPFMMLNFYLALRTTIELYQMGSCGGAVGLRDMMKTSYDYWSVEYDDPDIDADWELVQDLSLVIDAGCVEPVFYPVAPFLGCFLF